MPPWSSSSSPAHHTPMAPAKNKKSPCHVSVLQLVLLSAVVFFPAAASTSRCSNPSPAPKELPEGNDDDARELLRSFQITTGYFSGGGRLFAPDDESSFIPRSFSLSPYKVARTTDPALLEVATTLTLFGVRSSDGGGGARRRRHRYMGSQTASFHLHGYYRSASGELCMVGGSGSYTGDDGFVEHLRDVNLLLRVPNAPSLSDPFVTGLLDGADFETISLVAYVESDRYGYREKKPSCPPPTPERAKRGALQALEANFSCPQLRELLVSSYKLEHAVSDASSPSSPFPLSTRRMHVNQMHCLANGSVRAYIVFSNDTDAEPWQWQHMIHNLFFVKEEAVVADGYWDATTSRLCLTACHVVHSSAPEPFTTDLKVNKQCGIGMIFWFPTVWTLQDRSVVAGLLWNASQDSGNKHAAGGDVISGAISASSIDGYRRSNISDVKYSYTMVDKAKKHYVQTGLSKSKKGRFPGNSSTYSYQDFRFRFGTEIIVSGRANPVTIGSVMVDGDMMAAEDAFFHHTMEEMNISRPALAKMDRTQLLNISYDISYYHVTKWKPPKNSRSYLEPLERRRISAEGVYDPQTGILCMVGCQEINSSTDCQILITVHFASLDAKGKGHGRGRISSMRDKADRLYFDVIDIALYGMYTEQMEESIWRMDLESMMAVVSATLSCIFAVLQIRRTKANPAAAPATSVAMLAVVALGYVTHLVLNVNALFGSSRRRQYYVPVSASGWLELNEVMLRVPTLIAFALQLCLLQLVWSKRRSAAADRPAKAERWSLAERKSLWICLPLYLLGGLLAGTVHAMNNGRAARENPLIVRLAADPATLWDDLASYAGLILDGFLLPQVIFNALSTSRVKAISPWFYAGGTVLRAAPHVYDVFRAHSYVPSLRPSYVYATPRDDLFSVAWDVAVPLGAASLALLLFLQQRLGGAFFVRGRGLGEYEMVSTVGSGQEVEKAMDHGHEDATAD